MNTTTLEDVTIVPQAMLDIKRQLQHIEQVIEGATRHDAAGMPAAAGPTATATVTAPRQSRRKRERTSPMNAQSTTTSQGSNMTLEHLLARATELGEQAGNGKDTQIKFDLVVLEAAYKGVLDLAANKHPGIGGDRIDDATKMAEAYVRAQQGAVIFDTKAANQRKHISNVRKMIKLGGLPKFGPSEPLQTANDLVTERQKLRKDPANHKRLDDAHNMLMRWATAQLKSDTLIPLAEAVQDFAYKVEADTRAAEDVLEGVRKQLLNLREGKVTNCPEVDNSPEVQNAIKALTTRLTAIAKARAPAQNVAP